MTHAEEIAAALAARDAERAQVAAPSSPFLSGADHSPGAQASGAFPGAGIWEGIPSDAYHADPCPEPSLSAGEAVALSMTTPAHVYAASPRLNPQAAAEDDGETKFDVGTAAHALLTGVGGKIFRVDAPDWRTKAAKEEREAARGAGMTPLLAHQHDAVLALVRAARVQMRASGIGDPFDGSANEMSLFWQADGIWCRARPDCMTDEGVTYDLKTTGGSASPRVWARRAEDAGLHIRVAHYLDGLNRLAPVGRGGWRYRFVVVETEAPFGLMVYEATEGMVELGRRELARSRAIWRECLDAGRWPGYPAEVMPLELPSWAESRMMERELREEDRRKAAPSRRLIDHMIALEERSSGRAALP